jgi:PAS domain S-box-containing protein
LLPWTGAAIAVAIFALDLLSSPKIAVGALYLAAVLIAGRFCRTRGVALTAVWCAYLLLLASYFDPENPISTAIRICAVGLGTFLVLKARAAEDAAHRSEVEWREVFEHNPVMYLMADASGKILSVNGFGAAQLGYRVDELVGQSVSMVCPPSDKARMQRNLDVCLQQPGQSNTWEIQQVRQDGATFWVRENAKAVLRSSGELVVLIACEDTTERKRAEEAGRESARRFRALIEHAYDVILLLDGDCSVLYASPSVERVFAYAQGEMVGRNALDLVHPDQRDEARNLFSEAQNDHGSVLTSERLFRHKNGRWLWTENTITNLLHEPSVRAFVVNIRDISGRKKAEDALRQSEERFRDYTETASDWFWESGPDHRFTGFSHTSPFRGAGIGATLWELAAHPEEEPDKWSAYHATLNAHEPFRGFTFRVTGPDGSTVHISMSGKPVFEGAGRFQGYRGVATDVSDTVRAEQIERALQETRMQLAHVARVTSLGEMTASIAHEINQPMASIALNARAGQRWLGVTPPNLAEARMVLTAIARDAQRAGDMIHRIRAMARNEPFKMDPLDINDAIREVIALTRGEISHSRVTLDTVLAEALPIIRGDRVQLQQVVLNLILNAIEAIGHGSRRELMIETREDNGRYILVSVSDTGPGLDSQTLPRLFDAFYTTKPSGLGMGLPICRSIIAAHGGRIWAAAREPSGAVFQFMLPADPGRIVPAGDAGTVALDGAEIASPRRGAGQRPV